METRREGSAAMGEQLVGTVTHYFGKPHVAIVEVTAGELHVGDTIRITGHSSDFTQQIGSMELEHDPVESAKVGDSVGIQVNERAREHDEVYLLTDD
jgi:translation elongation factor EF-1alpha